MTEEQEGTLESSGEAVDEGARDAALADIQAAVSGQTLGDAAAAGDEEAAAATAQDAGDEGDDAPADDTA